MSKKNLEFWKRKYTQKYNLIKFEKIKLRGILLRKRIVASSVAKSNQKQKKKIMAHNFEYNNYGSKIF